MCLRRSLNLSISISAVYPGKGRTAIVSMIKCPILVSVALLTACLCGAEPATNYVARLAPVPACSALQAAAKGRGIPVSGFDPLAGTNALAPGDSVTMLISLHVRKHSATQWLMYFQATGDAKGSPKKPGAPTVIYTSTGKKFEFPELPAMIRVRTLGPFTESNSRSGQPRLEDKSAAIDVNQTFLGLGLDGAVEALHRLYQLRDPAKDRAKFGFSIANRAFSAAQINQGQMIAAKWHITTEEERSLAGGIPALLSYFETIEQTPELDSIMFKVLSLPSVWSIVHHLGITPGIEIARPANRVAPLSLPAWNLPSGSPLYALPVAVTLNQHPALTLTLVVTAPHPPFLTCGGIVGFLAENPDEKEDYLTLRIISAHYGTSATNARPGRPAIISNN